jgi:predicted enzyme related to lactoylglutathione lyase
MTETTLTKPSAGETSSAAGLGSPVWYELMAPDPAAVAPFYRAVIGWEIDAAGTAMPNGSEYRMIGRADGGNAGGVLTLTGQMREGGARPGWMTYFYVDDVDAATAKAQQLGAAVHMPPTSMGDVGRMAMLADPQGAAFYLMKPTAPADKPDAQSDVFQPNTPGHCWWNELETTDEPGATAFYTALFGWKADQTMPMGDKGDYRFIEQDGPLGAINPWMADYMSVGWVPYFGVADIVAARDAVGANGGTIHHDIHEVPGGDQIFVAADPAGAVAGFVGKKGA